MEGEELEKTRGQTAALKEITEQSPEKPKVPRESTMAVTAKVNHIVIFFNAKIPHCFITQFQEGSELLEGETLERTRGQTAAKEAEQEEEEDGEATTPSKIKRTTTIAQTAEVQLNTCIKHYTKCLHLCLKALK